MPQKRVGWLDVDLIGLKKLLARRGKEFVIYELVQNAWDEKCTELCFEAQQLFSVLSPVSKDGESSIVRMFPPSITSET
jgi:hypothetical protein